MQELLILAVVLTAIGVLIGFGYGIYALRMMGDQPNPSTLRLAALNLLEPGATIGTLLVIFVATDAANSGESAPVLLYLAAIPLTVMLLAPLVTRAESALHRTVVVYGGLRWVNTVAIWVVLVTGGNGSGDENRIAWMVALIAIGILILWASVIHIGSSLETAKTQSAR